MRSSAADDVFDRVQTAEQIVTKLIAQNTVEGLVAHDAPPSK
jgi:hypothetical protein